LAVLKSLHTTNRRSKLTRRGAYDFNGPGAIAVVGVDVVLTNSDGSMESSGPPR
jgi:hypothetical protein